MITAQEFQTPGASGVMVFLIGVFCESEGSGEGKDMGMGKIGEYSTIQTWSKIWSINLYNLYFTNMAKAILSSVPAVYLFRI